MGHSLQLYFDSPHERGCQQSPCGESTTAVPRTQQTKPKLLTTHSVPLTMQRLHVMLPLGLLSMWHGHERPLLRCVHQKMRTHGACGGQETMTLPGCVPSGSQISSKLPLGMPKSSQRAQCYGPSPLHSAPQCKRSQRQRAQQLPDHDQHLRLFL